MPTRSFRSINSRKSDLQRKEFGGSDSSGSDNAENWEEDFDPSDSDSFDSDDSKNRRKKDGWGDEEKGSGRSNSSDDDDDDDDDGSHRSSETDSDSSNSTSSSSSSSCCDSEDSQERESKIVRSKLLAIGLTVLCVVLLLSAVAFSVSLLLGGKDGGGETELETSVSVMTPTDPVTSAPTPAPTTNSTLSPTTKSPTLPPTKAPEPTDQPTVIIITGDFDETGDDDFFNDDDNSMEQDGIPVEIVVTSNGDTYVSTEEVAGVPPSFGSSPSLLVQSRNNVAAKNEEEEDFANADNGNSTSTDNSDGDGEDGDGNGDVDGTSYALLNFYMGDNPWYQKNSDLVNYDIVATVCLEQVPDSKSKGPWGNPRFNENGQPVNKIFALCRLKNSVDMVTTPEAETEALVKDGKVGTGKDVETIPSIVANYSMPEDCMDGGPNFFNVNASSATVCVDVTDFVRNYSPFVREEVNQDESSSLTQSSSLDENRNIRRRFLQIEQEETKMPVEAPDIDSETANVDGDAEILSNETTATPTKVEDFGGDAETIVDASNYKNILFMIANIEGNQDASTKFYSVQNPNNAPIMFLTLTEKPPTVSPRPTDSPTDIPTPVEVLPATLAPTSWQSQESTYEAEFTPCGLCGNFPSFVPLKEDELKIPLELAPSQIASRTPPDSEEGKATCNEFEKLCLDGYCTPQLCASLQTANTTEFCGCLAPVEEPCGLCEDDETLESPNTLVDLTTDQAPLGEATTMTCASLEGSCQGGFCSPGVCKLAQNDVRCGCRSNDPSAAQSIAQPSAAPSISMVPTASLQPSFKAEFERCSICGGDSIDFLLKDVNLELQDEITPPQVTNGTLSCNELESYCEGGYCSPSMCLSYQQSEPIIVTCGCSNEDNVFVDRGNSKRHR